MNNQKPGMFIPALIGGSAAGILSAVPIINCFCCIWIIGGAMFASYLLLKDSPVVLSAGDGAIVGVFTGIIATIVDTIVDIPFRSLNLKLMQNFMDKFSQYLDEMPPGWDNYLQEGDVQTSIPMFMLGLLFAFVVFAALGALGGIIGISIFGKKKSENTEGDSGVS